MAAIKDTKSFMRITHRYLGYFAAGIMAVYAISGVLLIYRDTNFLKKENKTEIVLKPNLTDKELAKEIKMRNVEFKPGGGDLKTFENGTYNAKTGEAKYSKMKLPFVLEKFNELHKSTSNHRYASLNTVFGLVLFFFVISSFWMFNFKSKAFRRGMIYAGIGFVLALIMVFFQ
ncbi:hypothetical protein L0B70_08420 [Kaistella sp. 97-N-M2]|uniref:hypothetical protein n=1 Tax=Kaistella sp. 97-N-M2 TaxID=2908645 RepID=UPI001F226C88|nr:hypothetical protein [Kaistella sp. 97-N-M2]UJF28887.1 hypothetical protein L0B70_08420 [Kaistella sp. 97-N-M2]